MNHAASFDSTRGNWSSASVRPHERTEAWSSALAENFCSWHVDKAVDPGFSAEIRHRDFGDVRVVESRCDPCSGGREKALIDHENERYFGVQIVRDGRKQIEVDAELHDVSPGDILFCTSDRPIHFAVTERTHKVSLVLPWSEIRERLPERKNFKSALLSGREGIGAVLFSHIESLGAQMNTLRSEDIGAARRSTIELVVAALSHRLDSPPKALALVYLERLQAYVLENLHDDTLSPASIAQAHRMSVRYVHLLFARLDLSVSVWIRMQRLERCREELARTAHSEERVSEIAYRWGFRDPLHFSRLFKKHYGLNPTQFRMGQAG